MISVISGEAGKVDMVELGFSPETNEAIVCGLTVDEVIISETAFEIMVDRAPEVASISRLVTDGALVSV